MIQQKFKVHGSKFKVHGLAPVQASTACNFEL